MISRAGLLASTTLIGLAGLLPNQACAGLIGAGNTVQAFYYNGVFADPEGEIPVGAGSDDPASLATAVNYKVGAADFSTISVDDTQITITNQEGGFPFCLANTPGNACIDQIDGFDFQFTGEDITGVSVDPASAADFAPVNGTFQGNTHSGLQLIGPDEIQVDVTGDEPAIDDQLILDVSFTPASTTPEPGTLPLLAGALGLCFLLHRLFRRSGITPPNHLAGE